jgi:hypothetical protein
VDDLLTPSRDAQRQALYDQVIPVAIYDQPWKQVCLGVNQSVGSGGGVVGERSPAGNSGRDAPLPEGSVNGLVGVPTEQANNDLRTAIEVAPSQELAPRVTHGNHVSIGGIARDPLDSSRVDPRMSVLYGLFSIHL